VCDTLTMLAGSIGIRHLFRWLSEILLVLVLVLEKDRFGELLVRTEQNVIDSDGTAIFSIKPLLSGGSKKTADFARKHGKPLLHLHPGIETPGQELADFIRTNGIKILNVSGGIVTNAGAVVVVRHRPGNALRQRLHGAISLERLVVFVRHPFAVLAMARAAHLPLLKASLPRISGERVFR
jgi:hypothetical protein